MRYPARDPSTAPTVAMTSTASQLQGAWVSGSTTLGSDADWLTFQPAMGTITSEGMIGTKVSSPIANATPT